MRYHLTSDRMAIIKKKKKKSKETQKIKSVDENMGRLKDLCMVGGNVKWKTI